MIVDLVILAGWVGFWLYWLIAAANVKPGRTRWARFAGVRVVLVVLVVLLLRLHVLKGHAGFTHSPWLQGAGLAVFVAGLALAVWARLYIGQNWGMPMSEKTDPQLVTTGPYRLIRHPIYSGIILAMIGTALAGSVFWLVAVGVIGGYFIYSAVMEERYMNSLFPDTYPAYRRSTKMLIPFLV